jgi:hypothetical protein
MATAMSDPTAGLAGPMNFLEFKITRAVDFIAGRCRRFGKLVCTFEIRSSSEDSMSVELVYRGTANAPNEFSPPHLTIQTLSADWDVPATWLTLLQDALCHEDIKPKLGFT